MSGEGGLPVDSHPGMKAHYEWSMLERVYAVFVGNGTELIAIIEQVESDMSLAVRLAANISGLRSCKRPP
jgi:hypothetical protein